MIAAVSVTLMRSAPLLVLRMLKVRCDKNKFQSAAMCGRSVFQNVLEEMNKSAPQSIGQFIVSLSSDIDMVISFEDLHT